MDGFTVIFTDLDGTLLDHNNYSFAPATPCLDYIHKTNIPLIFTSSKTAVEIESLCAQTSLYHPYIAENGGLLSIPKNYFSTNTSSRKKYEKKLIGKSRKSINLILQNLCEIYKFKSFNDMAISEIISLIGLEKNQALYANQRDCTEQIVWLDNNDKLKTFSEELEKYDLQLLSGGRFHHVMGKHNKVTTMELLLDDYQKHFDKKTISSVKLITSTLL